MCDFCFTNHPSYTKGKFVSMSEYVKRYARRPFTVDAVQLTEDNFDLVVEWCGGEKVEPAPGKKYIRVPVINPRTDRQRKAFLTDWVLRSDKGGFKVYTNAAFNGSFERAI